MLSEAARGHAARKPSFRDDADVERYTRRSAPGPVQGPGRAPEEDYPPPRGATVFENSTACTLFGRTPAERCVQVRHRRLNAPLEERLGRRSRINPVLRSGALCVHRAPICRLAGGFTAVRPALCRPTVSARA